MSEERTFPRWLPRPGHKISITIGEPINATIEPLLAQCKAQFPIPWRPETYEKNVGEDLKDEPKELAGIRSHIAKVLRDELMKVGVEARRNDKELLK